MHETNICKDLEVLDEKVENRVEKMMEAQYALQRRLGKLVSPTANPKDLATLTIYWRQCIHTECDELMEWFKDPSSDRQEIEMEAIDILHFVMNIGISFDMSPGAVQYLMKGYSYTEVGTRLRVKVMTNIMSLSLALTKFIDQLPWKTWKTYTIEPLPVLLPEYIEILSSSLDICASLGMDKDRIYNCYMAKNKENHARQDRGY